MPVWLSGTLLTMQPRSLVLGLCASLNHFVVSHARHAPGASMRHRNGAFRWARGRGYPTPPEPIDDPPEPIAGGEAAQPGSSSTGPQGAPPPTRQELRRRFDQLRMAGAQEATTMRQKRAGRTRLLESGYRVFTTDLLQADSHRCHVDISP